MRHLPLTADRLPAAVDLVAQATRRRAGLAGRATATGDEARRAADLTLRPYVEEPDRVAFVAVDRTGAAHAVLGGILTRLTPRDVGYTYLPPEQVLCPLGGWAARDDAAAAEHLPRLLSLVRERARAEGVERVGLQSLDADWWSAGVWRAAGLRPDTVFAARPLAVAQRRSAPTVTVRAGTIGDLDAVVALSREEQIHHARHTGSGMSEDQDPRTVRGIAAAWFDHDADEGVERAFVAVDANGTVVGVTTAHVLRVPAGSVGAALLPERHGYIGLTDVAASARGNGVGAALVSRALGWFRDLPDPPAVVGLHYVVDNALSAPFWSGQGFAPVLTLLTSAPRHR